MPAAVTAALATVVFGTTTLGALLVKALVSVAISASGCRKPKP